MGIEIRQCTIEDIQELCTQAIEPMCKVEGIDPQHGIAMENGTLLACGGIQPGPEGVGTAWLIVGPTVPRRDLIEVIVNYLAHADFRRIQCIVRKDFSKGRRLARWLGFHKEGVLRKYTPDGSDVVLYAMVKE